MRAEPFLDFAEVDLSKVLYTQDDIFSPDALKQDGRFRMLDAIVVEDIEGELAVGYKDIRDDEWWAEDHIPGRPIFPGTMMIEAAAQLCSFDFYLRRPDAKQKFCGFTSIGNTRFRAAVYPGTRFYVAAKLGRVRATLFNYKLQGYVDQAVVFETEITGMVF